MTPAEKRFWRLLADLTSEAKVLGDGGERLAAAFQDVVTALEKTPTEARAASLVAREPQ